MNCEIMTFVAMSYCDVLLLNTLLNVTIVVSDKICVVTCDKEVFSNCSARSSQNLTKKNVFK